MDNPKKLILLFLILNYFSACLSNPITSKSKPEVVIRSDGKVCLLANLKIALFDGSEEIAIPDNVRPGGRCYINGELNPEIIYKWSGNDDKIKYTVVVRWKHDGSESYVNFVDFIAESQEIGALHVATLSDLHELAVNDGYRWSCDQATIISNKVESYKMISISGVYQIGQNLGYKYSGAQFCNGNELKRIEQRPAEGDDPGATPTEPATTPTEPATTPTEPATTPTEPATTPTEPATTPTEPATTPTEPATTPTEPATTPTEPATTPTEPATTPTEPATTPTEPATTPTEPATTPTEPATTPTEPATTPTEPATTPTEPATTPTEPATTPTEPGTTPTEPGTTPTEPGTTPTEPGTTPTEPGTTPTEPATTPTEPGTTPTEPGTTPTEPGTTPTEPGTTPTEPATTPTEPTTTPQPETTTPPATDDKPSFTVTDPSTNKKCILASMKISVTVPYVALVDGKLTNKTQTVSTPAGATVTGLCSGQNGTLDGEAVVGPLLVLTWNWLGPKSKANSINVKNNFLAVTFKTEDDETSIAEITPSIQTSGSNFPDANDPNSKYKFTVSVDDYVADKGESYACSDAQSFSQGDGSIELKDVQFQVGSDLGDTFAEGSDCNDSGDNTVAIAVGVTVAVLIVIVVGGFLYKRYRDKKKFT